MLLTSDSMVVTHAITLQIVSLNKIALADILVSIFLTHHCIQKLGWSRNESKQIP